MVLINQSINQSVNQSIIPMSHIAHIDMLMLLGIYLQKKNIMYTYIYITPVIS